MMPTEPRNMDNQHKMIKDYRDLTQAEIAAIARACHEIHRAWCLLHEDYSQVSWDDAPDWQRTSVLHGVSGALDGATPEQSHASWLAEKAETGWKYGAVKDPDKKEHPCCVPYGDLPPEQKAKDSLFVGTVRAMAAAMGVI